MFTENLSIQEVFRTNGTPTVTYVTREDGKLEKQLHDVLEGGGYLCLITGPSKTGKTTLYERVLETRKEVPLKIECDASMTAKDIWTRALERVDFARAETRKRANEKSDSAEVKSGAKLSWLSLIDWSAEVKGNIGAKKTDEEVRRSVLAEPNSSHLTPILERTNYVLVVEDFHYLPDKEKAVLFQQSKKFVDANVSIVLLTTSHRAVDIANSNKDLIGRVHQIDIGRWSERDLKEIINSGVKYLGLKESDFSKLSQVAAESVGLPIITQQCCCQFFLNAGVSDRKSAKATKVAVTDKSIFDALHNVASTKYSQFSGYYSALIRGPREKSRKYPTYEAVLACFALDPIQFSLTRAQIDERIAKLSLEPGTKPPAASINSTLGALRDFQQRRKFSLLEWQAQDNTLYIIEPAFLFYVRWRENRQTQARQLDLFEVLIDVQKVFDKYWGGSRKLSSPQPPAKN